MGVPLNTPLAKEIPGICWLSLLVSVGVGVPVAVTEKLKAVPLTTVVVLGLVKTGAASTTSEKVWLSVPPRLVAVNVSG